MQTNRYVSQKQVWLIFAPEYVKNKHREWNKAGILKTSNTLLIH